VIRTPVRAPKANAVAERFVGTVRRECLDLILIVNRRHIQHVLRAFIDHYNGHRRTARSASHHPNLARKHRSSSRQPHRSAETTGSVA
jgi:putative transposase